jgi:hypothetical protein
MASMTERVVPVLPGVRWDPNAPMATMITNDMGVTVLAANPHGDDPSRDCVVFVWTGTAEAVMGGQNDEGRFGHRLYDRGLAGLRWAGLVEDSQWIAELRRTGQTVAAKILDPERARRVAERATPQQHYILPLKENTVEVIADRVEVRRHPRPTLDAAARTLRSL